VFNAVYMLIIERYLINIDNVFTIICFNDFFNEVSSKTCQKKLDFNIKKYHIFE
ncbi:MAG: hypothetical protein RL308_3559, partial [Bacteroidota bacterium]